MSRTIDQSIHDLREMDELASKASPIHAICAAAKLLVTVAYIMIVVSYDKYNMSGLLFMVFYPAVLFAVSEVPVTTCLYKLRFVLPLVCAVGVLNPFLDRTPAFAAGSFVVTTGMISMVTLMTKGVFCLMASFLLMATTRIEAVCSVLRKIHVPSFLVTLLLLTYRYAAVMAEEVGVMTKAYSLRAPDQKGIHYSAWGSFLGQLLYGGTRLVCERRSICSRVDPVFHCRAGRQPDAADRYACDRVKTRQGPCLTQEK